MDLAIDFGTSYTKLGCLQDGRFINLAGSDINVPSVATWLPSTNKLYFGRLALRLQEPGAHTARFFKLMLKRGPSFHLGPYALPELMSQYFSFLVDEYITSRRAAISSLVLSVPNYFGLHARRLLLEAAQAATGTTNIRLLPEPVAALLGHNHNHPAQALTGDILCIDIGGGTTDFSFLSLSGQGKEILLEAQFQIGNDAFSGSELDRGVLHNIFSPAFTMQTGMVMPDNLMLEKNLDAFERYRLNSLMQKAEDTRIKLGQQGYLHCDIPDFCQGQSLVLDLEPEFFDKQMEPIFTRLRDYFLNNVRTKAERLGFYRNGQWELDHVLLLGGASLTRGVKEMISHLCPGVMIISPREMDSAVVRGLCHWSDEGFSAKTTIKNIYPFDFYIEKKATESDSFCLEKIPFDTSNLELDLEQIYPIFSFPFQSDYNLAADSENLHCRIYEISEGEDPNDVTPDRFLGQEILLETEDENNLIGENVTICLNLEQSRIELTGCEITGGKTKSLLDWRHELPNHQQAALSLLKDFPLIDKRLKNDFDQHLQQISESSAYKSWENTALYKMLYLIQILEGK
ncbi:MAG: Hsp70 family protein [Syntrophomonadaceae bacterium]|nr:Hsp70 family protein [Syntrophomonadaceae bacterium]